MEYVMEYVFVLAGAAPVRPPGGGGFDNQLTNSLDNAYETFVRPTSKLHGLILEEELHAFSLASDLPIIGDSYSFEISTDDLLANRCINPSEDIRICHRPKSFHFPPSDQANLPSNLSPVNNRGCFGT